MTNKFRIRQVLAALDLSEMDEHILAYLDYLNTYVYIDELYFLHVVVKTRFWTNLLGWESTLKSNFVLDEDIVKHIMGNVKAKLRYSDLINIEYDIKEGNRRNQLLNTISEQQIDVAFVGKKPNSEASGVLVRNVARKSKCSVWVVPQNALKPIEQILVPIDFSESSTKALKRAIEFNKYLEKPAQITCVHIYKMPDMRIYQINETHEQVRELLEQDLNSYFDEFLEEHIKEDRAIIKTQLIERIRLSTAGNLLECAQGLKANLVFMGAKGHSAISRILLGSVTENFIQLNDQIPTYIVR
ncbi:MAG: universal stress protein [Aureispira sp.]|nr:universal stress protein [Aureispira sp.]